VIENARPVTGAVPVLVRVMVWLAEAAMAMLPKFRAEAVTTRCDWMPMPVRVALMGREESEVEMATVPVRVPVWLGVKVICSVQLVAGARVLPGVGQVPTAV
jgi:hypothetical protein